MILINKVALLNQLRNARYKVQIPTLVHKSQHVGPCALGNITYTLVGEVVHASGHAVSEHREVTGREGVGGIREVVVVRPRSVVSEEGQELAEHDVLHHNVDGF